MKPIEAKQGIIVKVENEYAVIEKIRHYGVIIKYIISKQKAIAKYQVVQIVQAEELFEQGWKMEEL